MTMSRAAVVLASLAFSICAAQAQGFRLEEVPSVALQATARLAPGTIIFSDHTQSSKNDPTAGLVHFDEWARTSPAQKQNLALFPCYAEPVLSKKVGGVTHTYKDKLTMYVAEARFVLAKAPSSLDLSRYASLSFLERIDPAVKDQLIAPTEVAPLTNPKAAHNANPARPWCVGKFVIACVRSHYRLEGKLPMGITLANKLRDGDKKIPDYLEFESELAVHAPDDIDQAAVTALTGLDTPISGTLEQTTLYVNQVLQFAKFLAVFQQHPSDPAKTVVSAYMALAIESNVIEKKKEFERVPVLRNLVPAQVLMGKSSFNVGKSISAGLPKYARSRIKAIAGILAGG